MAEETEVDGALRNSLTIGRGLGDVSRASTGVCISPLNLIVTKSSSLKNLIVPKDLEQYRSPRLQSTIKLLLAMII
jgi:hypothetical protein